MRFGVSAWPAGSGEEWRETARRAEEFGYETLWVADHVGLPDPFAAMVAAAGATTSLRVGTYVLNVEFWNPLLLARAVATTDVVTDGRLVLGIGAGHNADEFTQAGLRYPSATERVGRLEATVPVLRRLLAGDAVDDERLGLVGAATGLTAVDTPILVGGNGDRVLSLAGREADMAGLVGFTAGTGRTHTDLSHWGWDGLADRLAHVRAAATDAGRDEPPPVDLLVQRARVTDDPAAALADFVDGGLDERAFDSPFLLVGTEDELVAKLGRLQQEHGVGGVTVFGRDAESFAPVLARVRNETRPSNP